LCTQYIRAILMFWHCNALCAVRGSVRWTGYAVPATHRGIHAACTIEAIVCRNFGRSILFRCLVHWTRVRQSSAADQRVVTQCAGDDPLSVDIIYHQRRSVCTADWLAPRWLRRSRRLYAMHLLCSHMHYSINRDRTSKYSVHTVWLQNSQVRSALATLALAGRRMSAAWTLLDRSAR